MKQTTILILLLINFSGFTQTYTGKHFVLNNNQTGQNKTYIARDYIKLAQGFRYTAQPGKTFIGKIDPSLIFDTEYSDNQTPWSSNLPVGSLPGSVNVSPSGAATYNIPVALPPGTAGMMPNLSIVYNSQSGDGMLGKGWTIGGFSAITRIPATLYHDNKVDGVDFDANDRFALDGQRLIAVSGTYGAHNTEYRTENETFSKIKSYYTSGNGPLKFFVETKSGIKMQYAYTEDSRIQAGGVNGNSVMYWLLNKVYDTKGNYYTITYKEENGEFYPLEINYTGHGNNSEPYNKIKFFYTRKTDKSIAYVAGSEFKSTVLLSDIKIYNKEHLIRKYSFKYNYNMFSRLSEIQLYEDRNKIVNTTKIQWKEYTNNFYAYKPGGESAIRSNYNLLLQNDLNNDGISDFIYFIPSSSNIHNISSIISTYAETEFKGGYLTANTGNFHGNGKNEVLVVRNKDNKGNEDSKGSKYFYLYKAEKPFFTGNKILNAKIDGHLEVGDFNGDGKTDFLFENNNYIKIYRVGANSAIHYLTFSKINRIKKIKTADFNGDGVSDIFVISGQKPYLRVYDVSKKTQNLIYSSNLIEKDDRFNLADFNGDGKIDILVEKKQNKTIKDRKLYLSTGISYVYSTKISVSNLKNILTGDFNGDGKEDIVITEKTDNGSEVKYYYYIFNNNVLTEICEGIFDTDSGAQFNFKTFSNKSDFKYGDGKQEIVAFDDKNSRYFVFSFQKYYNTKVVKSITDGYNNKTEFEYKPITDESVYTQGSGATFPVVDFRGPLYVVKNLKAPNGIGTQQTTQSYFYEAAKVHKQGKGFLGFMKVKSENLTTHIISETEYTYNPTYFNTYPVSSKTYYTYYNSSSLISSSTVTNQYIHYFGNKRIFSYPKQTITTDHLTNTSVTTITDIDYNTGNLNRTFTSTPDGTTETLYQNYIQAGAWLPTKPTKTIINKTATGKPTYTRTSTFEYYNNGLLKKSIADPYEDKPVTTEYQYNSFGNVIHTKITSPAEQEKNSYLSYDDKNRFVISQTDPLGFTSYKTYDEETGNVLSETDINGHTTKFKYDAFGSLIETELPDGTKSYRTTNWYTAGSISNAKTFTITSADGEAPVKTYFDILGRKIRTETQGFNNETIISKTQYNDKGQVSRTYEPYFEGETGNYATFYYDKYGRQTKIISPTGTTQYTYNFEDNKKKTKITYPDNSFKISTINNLGQIITAQDNGGTINYEYNSAGLPTTISTAGGVTITITYDIYGNKTSLSDPDAGTIYYEYDAFSNITKQTDANGNIHNMTYDIAGRIIQKSGTEGITNYEYDTAPNGKGMLASESGINGNTKTYVYDNLSRLQSVTENFEGENYTYAYTYDKLGRISKATYPNGFAYIKKYKNNGYLQQINTENGHLIWKPLNRNAQGQITELQKGNGLTTYKTYDNISHMPETVITGTIQDVEYEFENTTGNLLSRTDYIHNNTETFTYDNLNRLTQINTNGNIFNINYDNTGNITNKTDAGIYAYDNEKIHAVTQVTGDVYLPSFNQNITYTAFNKVNTINEGSNELIFIYGLNNKRKKTELYKGKTLIRTKYFFGSYEKTIEADTITEYCFLPGGAIYKTTNGKGEMLYTYTDHLGSITHVTDAEGKLLAEFSYGAWGRARNPETWALNPAGFENPQGLALLNGRGYTAHEMLPRFGIINMNGRLYDPVLGRMLSPDNYIQLPDYTQNFNRYSYVLNNPLKYTDPSGEWVHLVVGAVMGAYTGLMAGIQAGATGWKLIGYVGVGAVAGALTAGVGAGVSSVIGGGTFGAGFVGSSTTVILGGGTVSIPNSVMFPVQTSFINGATIGAASGFTGGFVTGMGTGLLEGQTFGQSLKQGAIYGGIGAVSGGLFGGIDGGLDAVMDKDPVTGQGRNFWHGGRKIVDISNPIIKVKQNTIYDCTYASAESNDAFIGGGNSQSYYKGKNPGLGGRVRGNGLEDIEIYDMYHNEGYNVMSMPTNDTKNYIAGQMQQGRAVSLSYNTNTTIGGQRYAHNVAVQRIKLYDNGKYVIRIMDPATGTFRRLTSTQYSNIRLILSIW